jgi:hypothetical protein
MNRMLLLIFVMTTVVSAAFSQTIAVNKTEGPGYSAVTGAPYSAEEVTQHTQALTDGTHITEPSRTMPVFRDSKGRTRA